MKKATCNFIHFIIKKKKAAASETSSAWKGSACARHPEGSDLSHGPAMLIRIFSRMLVVDLTLDFIKLQTFSMHSCPEIGRANAEFVVQNVASVASLQQLW